jgi:apolipoprotein N-acyltransferase
MLVFSRRVLGAPLLCWGGGLAMGLALAPVSWSFLAWAALIPLWSAAVGSPSIQRRLLLGAVWGLSYYGLGLWWLTGIHPMTWMGVPWGASLAIAGFAWGAVTLWGMVLAALWSWGLGFAHNPYLRLIWGPALWTALESLWSRGPLWWNSLALTQSPAQSALLQWTQFSGEATLTAALVFINGLWAEALLAPSRRRRDWLLPLALIALLYGGGYLLSQRPLEDNPQTGIAVGLIQGNIPNEIKLYPQGLAQAIAGYSRGYQDLVQQGAEVVLTPEGALPYFWEINLRESDFYQQLRRRGVPVWLGAYGYRGEDYTNSLFSLDGQGELISRYDKVKRVPLGEYVPLSGLIGRWVSRLSPLKAQMVAGDEEQVFNTPFGPAAVTLCYESAFSDYLRGQVRRGALFILSSANNAHYSAAMPAQHHALDVLRAIENDRWLARAANTGYSALISPRGQTLWISDLNRYQLYLGQIYSRRTLTLYLRWGNWLTPVLLIGAGLTWLAALPQRSRFP